MIQTDDMFKCDLLSFCFFSPFEIQAAAAVS